MTTVQKNINKLESTQKYSNLHQRQQLNQAQSRHHHSADTYMLSSAHLRSVGLPGPPGIPGNYWILGGNFKHLQI